MPKTIKGRAKSPAARARQDRMAHIKSFLGREKAADKKQRRNKTIKKTTK